MTFNEHTATVLVPLLYTLLIRLIRLKRVKIFIPIRHFKSTWRSTFFSCSILGWDSLLPTIRNNALKNSLQIWPQWSTVISLLFWSACDYCQVISFHLIAFDNYKLILIGLILKWTGHPATWPNSSFVTMLTRCYSYGFGLKWTQLLTFSPCLQERGNEFHHQESESGNGKHVLVSVNERVQCSSAAGTHSHSWIRSKRRRLCA